MNGDKEFRNGYNSFFVLEYLAVGSFNRTFQHMHVLFEVIIVSSVKKSKECISLLIQGVSELK